MVKFLGPPQFTEWLANEVDEVGVANGLAWTEAGGDVMQVEVSVMDGKGALTLTGQLGEVMQEGAQAALTYARSHAHELGLGDVDFDKVDLHIHVPEAAIPKDGPSAGVTMATALISALSARPIRHDVAMTGEITLRGRVLPIGGPEGKADGRAPDAHEDRADPEAQRKRPGGCAARGSARAEPGACGSHG